MFCHVVSRHSQFRLNGAWPSSVLIFCFDYDKFDFEGNLVPVLVFCKRAFVNWKDSVILYCSDTIKLWGKLLIPSFVIVKSDGLMDLMECFNPIDRKVVSPRKLVIHPENNGFWCAVFILVFNLWSLLSPYQYIRPAILNHSSQEPCAIIVQGFLSIGEIDVMHVLYPR